jgi:transposase
VVTNRNSPQKHVWRATIILLTDDGLGTVEIMRRTGKNKTCVWRWQERFMAAGVEGLLRDKTRPSRVPPLPPEVVERVIALTRNDPPGETTHWTGAAMAEAAGISVSSVQRIWRCPGLQRIGCAGSSCPPIRNSPPSCTTLSGSISIRRPMRSCCRWTRRARSRRSTHPAWPAVEAGPGWHHDVFRSIIELQAAINRFLAETNDNPKPFTWTADPDKIIAAVRRGHQVLDSIH